MTESVPYWLQITSTIAGLVAAVAAAFSAWQSRKAAVANQVIAEQSRAAVADLYRPTIGVGQTSGTAPDGEHLRGVGITNNSAHTAYKVTVLIVMPDGKTHRERFESISPGVHLQVRMAPADMWPTFSEVDLSVVVALSATADYENRFGVKYHRQFEQSNDDGQLILAVDLHA